MNYIFVLLASFAGFLTVNNEKDTKRKNFLILIYASLIGIALLFSFGEFIGQFIYRVENL